MPLNSNNQDLKQLNEPFYIFRPKKLKKNVETFIKKFDGETIYSVKTNPNDYVIKQIYNSGIRSFDVASLKEIKLIKSLFPNCKIYYMNPVKPYFMIQKAYSEFEFETFHLTVMMMNSKKIFSATDKAKRLKFAYAYINS